MKIFILIVVCSLSLYALAQDLLGERIRKVTSSKTGVFLKQGIFHTTGPKTRSKLKGIRHSYKKSQGYERVVFDFVGKNSPKVYGHISGGKKRFYIDLFNTELGQSIDSFGNSRYVESINFFPVNGKDVSVEVVFKNSVSVDLFYLTSPGRFVLDIKS